MIFDDGGVGIDDNADIALMIKMLDVSNLGGLHC